MVICHQEIECSQDRDRSRTAGSDETIKWNADSASDRLIQSPNVSLKPDKC
jgi:hypothetical protein